MRIGVQYIVDDIDLAVLQSDISNPGFMSSRVRQEFANKGFNIVTKRQASTMCKIRTMWPEIIFTSKREFREFWENLPKKNSKEIANIMNHFGKNTVHSLKQNNFLFDLPDNEQHEFLWLMGREGYCGVLHDLGNLQVNG